MAAVFCFGQAFAQTGDPDQEIGPATVGSVKKAVADEIAKFHTPKVTGMPASARMAAYEKRLKMESDSPFGQLKWRNVGPEIQSGRVVGIDAPVGQPNVLYIAFATGGLWKSDDYGTTFASIFDGYSSCGIGNFAMTKEGNTIWVGTGENNNQRTSYAGTGVFKSTDAGKTWQYMGLPESQHIGKILIDPRNENTVYVGALGHLYSQNPERGVYKTTDGGKTWQWVLKLDDQTGIIDMAMDPRNSDVIYATAMDRDRRAWDFRESGPGSGVYRTTDGGKNWKLIQELPHGEAAGRIGIAISKSNPDRIYVYADNHGENADWLDEDERVPSGTLTVRRFLNLTEEAFVGLDKKAADSFWSRYAPDDLKFEDAVQKVKDKKMTMEQLRDAFAKKTPNAFKPPTVQNELVRSNDGGKTWHRSESGPLGGNSYYYFGNVFINPKDPDDAFGTGTVLVRTRDGGKTWRLAARPVHVDFHAVWYDPADVKHIIVGNDGGAYESRDDGEHWRHLNNMPTGQATTVAVDNKTPYNIFVGLQDNGTMKGPSNYRPGISPLDSWTDVGGGDGAMIAVDPRNDGDIFYTGSQFGAEGGFDSKTKDRWSVTPRGQGNRYNWVSPIVISTFHPDIVYFGANKLYRSFDQGRHYEAISPDLTKNKPQGNVPFSTIKDFSESPLKFGVIYVGCDDGNVQVTRDGGVTWTLIPTPQPDKWVSRVVASKYDAATVYCSQSGYREDDWSAYLWKSTDYGKTWTSIVGDLPNETINVVREDPDHKNMLYAGTDLGVFVSFDGGSHWDALQGGLPHVPVHDLVIQSREHDLVIGTHARSAWVLSLDKVYDLTPELRNTDIKLFPVDNMRRDPNWAYGGGGGRRRRPS
ncbi:MAG: glycosyl hydrolase [Fimbriimonadales bacterium]